MSFDTDRMYINILGVEYRQFIDFYECILVLK